VNIFTNAIITLLAVALLMIPVFVLFEAHLNRMGTLVVISAATFTFAVALSVLTSAKRHDILMATAA